MTLNPFATRAIGAIGTTGVSITAIGFGAAPIGGLLRDTEPGAAADALRYAYDSGVRYVDTAPYYGFGRSERLVGEVLRDAGDCVLSSKVGRLLRPGAHPNPAALGWVNPLPFQPHYDYTHDGILRSLDDSLQRLGMAHIDLLLVHDIGEMTHGHDANERHFADLRDGGYRALESLRTSGAVKAIGLGVNESAICLRAMEIGDWDAFLLAGRYTLLEQAPLDDLLPQCALRKVALIIGGAFNSGVLAGGDTWNYGEIPPPVRARVTALSQAAEAYDIPLAAAALQFPLAHPQVASVIPGARNRAQWDEILRWARTDIPAEFWVDLKRRDLLHDDAPVPD